MAFGAGALMFAIAIELYGEALMDLRSGDQGRFELVGLALSTIVGALFYTAMDRFVLHRPTVSLNSLGHFGLSGPRASPRTEWLSADAERDITNGETEPLIQPPARRPSTNDLEADEVPDTEGRTAEGEKSFAIILWLVSRLAQPNLVDLHGMTRR